MLPIRSHRDLNPFTVHLHSPVDSGLGPLRRMVTIAEALAVAFPTCRLLLTTGSPRATWFPMPEGVALVKLPAPLLDARKQRPAGPSALELRRQMLLQVHRAWNPALLIVDQEPLGQAEELAPILREAPAHGLRTILGLRDIFGSGESLPEDWQSPRVRDALLEQYDRVLVYGSPEVFDARAFYAMPEALAQRLQFTGYIARNVPARPVRAGRPARVLFSGGSGEHGSACVETLIEALEQHAPAFESEIVLGPALPVQQTDALLRRAAALDRVRVHTSCSDVPELLSSCDAVVATAGYSTAVEVLQSRLPALFCPRSFPLRAQLLRAEHLVAGGHASLQANAGPEELLLAVGDLLQRGLSTHPLPPMDGCARIVEAVQELCASQPRVEARAGGMF